MPNDPPSNPRPGSGGPRGGSGAPKGKGSGGRPRSDASGKGRPSGGSGRDRGGRGGSAPDRSGQNPGAWRADRADDGRTRRPVPYAPEPDPTATADELDRDTRAELRGLPAGLADDVARHLVMAGRLLEEEPETAYQHAAKAQALASRVSVAREALGLAAYSTGRWAQALSELRAARRMSGSHDHLPVMADCERGLGRPERALSLAGSPEADLLDASGRIEMRIVAAGARRDLGQLDAAILTLQVPELKAGVVQPWTARLRYAYADALLAAGREDEARDWFEQAVLADPDGETEADERLAELDGTVIVDLWTEEQTAEERATEEQPPEEEQAR